MIHLRLSFKVHSQDSPQDPFKLLLAIIVPRLNNDIIAPNVIIVNKIVIIILDNINNFSIVKPYKF
jgi:hypothetical protein